MKSNKKKTDNYHHGDLKSTLIQTALKMLETMNPSDLSLREVAKKAGVSQAAPYRHFKDKEALLAAMSQQAFELKYRLMKEAIDAAKGDALATFNGCGLAYFKMGLKYPQHFKLMFSDQCEPSLDHPELLKAATATFVLVRDMVKLGQSTGLIGEGDPYVIAMNCWAVVHGFTTLYSTGHFQWLGVNEEIAENAFKTLMHQFLQGCKNGLVNNKNSFSLFKDEDSKMFKKIMEEL